MKPKKVTQFVYEAIVTRKIDGEPVEFRGIGIADETNVVGGDKNTLVKIEQMAEARAKRRALSDAFPCGLASYEDYQEMPDFNIATLPPPPPASTKKKVEKDPETADLPDLPEDAGSEQEPVPAQTKTTYHSQIRETIALRVDSEDPSVEDMDAYLKSKDLPIITEIDAMTEDQALDLLLKLQTV